MPASKEPFVPTSSKASLLHNAPFSLELPVNQRATAVKHGKTLTAVQAEAFFGSSRWKASIAFFQRSGRCSLNDATKWRPFGLRSQDWTSIHDVIHWPNSIQSVWMSQRRSWARPLSSVRRIAATGASVAKKISIRDRSIEPLS
ncbi:hypothetical protein EON81_17115 [bacterium]|nr:MAG: hypothetical protein EON81_17115 [bacterium]